jgi:hypothetical protein
MRKTLLPVLVLLVVGSLIALVNKRHDSVQKVEPKVALITPVTHPKLPQAKRPPLMTIGEWQQYHSARQLALQTNPSLKGQYKEILTEMDVQESKSDAAMLKADPKLAPVLAKLKALRLRNGGAIAAASRSGKTPPVIKGPASTLTPADWQELRTARAQAIEANPDLMAQARKLQEKMRAFEDNLDADMLKSDPQSAPLIAKFDSARHSPMVSNNSTGPK